MNCEDCKELIYDYLDGSLDPDVVHSFEQALSACDECSERLRQAKNIRASLQVMPSERPLADGRRAAIMAAAQAKAGELNSDPERSGVVVPFPGRLARWGLAVAAVLAGVVGYWVVQLNHERPAFDRGVGQESVARFEQEPVAPEGSGRQLVEHPQASEPVPEPSGDSELRGSLVDEVVMDQPEEVSPGLAQEPTPQVVREVPADLGAAQGGAVRDNPSAIEERSAAEELEASASRAESAPSRSGSEPSERSQRRVNSAPRPAPSADSARRSRADDRVGAGRESQADSIGSLADREGSFEDDSVVGGRGLNQYGSGGASAGSGAASVNSELLEGARGSSEPAGRQHARAPAEPGRSVAIEQQAPSRPGAPPELEESDVAASEAVETRDRASDSDDAERTLEGAGRTPDDSVAPVGDELRQMRAWIEAGRETDAISRGNELRQRGVGTSEERAELFFLMANAFERLGDSDSARDFYQRSADQGIGTRYGRTSYQRLQRTGR